MDTRLEQSVDGQEDQVDQDYMAEFRAESVEPGTEQNLSHQEAAARLGSSNRSLSNWVQTAKRQGKRVGGFDAMPTVAELQGKVARGASCPLARQQGAAGRRVFGLLLQLAVLFGHMGANDTAPDLLHPVE